MPMAGSEHTKRVRRNKGFRQAGTLLEARIRKVGESRGFAVSRLLTQWDEIVGPDAARIARPVEVSYGRGGLGATLTILTTGAHAPLLQMQVPRLQEKINACYGYAAISRIRITQTSPAGFFGECSGQSDGAGARPDESPAQHADGPTVAASALAADVDNAALRAALARLGQHVLKRSARIAGAPNERSEL